MNQVWDDSIRARAREQWNRVVAWVRRHPRRAVAIGVGAVLLFLLLRWLIPDAVSTVTLESRPVVETLVTTGRVRSVSRTDVGAPLVGTVDRVFVQEGDRVSAGELLFVLDDAELRAAADEARSALRVAEAARGRVATVELPSAASALDAAQLEAEQLARDVERMRVLFDAGGVSRQELEVAQREAEAAEARLARARASAVSFAEGGADRASADAAVAQARDAVDAALARLELTRVRAPSSGTVLIREVEPGDAVQPGAVLMQIALDGPTELIVFPDERSLGDLREGQPALASADPFPDRSFDAAVTRIAPVVDPQQGTIEVRLTVPAPPSYLLPDMTVSVNIVVDRRAAAWTLPIGVVRAPLSDTAWVLVVRDGRAERAAVELGIRDDQFIEIIAGVLPDEPVVAETPGTVEPGSRVRSRPLRD